MHIDKAIRGDPRRSERPRVSKLLMVSALALIAASITLVPEGATAAGPSGPMAPALPKPTASTPPVAPHVQVFEILPGQEPINVAPNALTATVVPNSSPLPQGPVDDSTASTASGSGAAPEDANGGFITNVGVTAGTLANTRTPATGVGTDTPSLTGTITKDATGK